MVAATMRSGKEAGYRPLPKAATLADHMRNHWIQIDEQEPTRHDDALPIAHSIGELIFGVVSAVGRTNNRLLEQRHKNRRLDSSATQAYLLDLFAMASVDCMMASAKMSKKPTMKAGEELLGFIDDLGIEIRTDLETLDDYLLAAAVPSLYLESLGAIMKNGGFVISADVKFRGAEADEELVLDVTEELWLMAGHYYELALAVFEMPSAT